MLKDQEKRTFLYLLTLTGFLCLLILVAAYYIPMAGLRMLHPVLPMLWLLILAAVGAAIIAGASLLTTSILLGRDIAFSHGLRVVVMKYMLPALIFVGKMVGVDKETTQHAFVGVSNELVMARCLNGPPPKRILLLMPHCLQFHDCEVRITHRVENCKRCGKCPIKGLLTLSEKYGVDLAVATGGTVARRIVKETRPDLILAVACERDLTSGIQDTLPLPVYGVFNDRPHGPCFDTKVAIDRVEAVLQRVMPAPDRTP